MKFPAGEPPSRLLATACRKPLSELDALLPPSAVIRLLKLVCSVASAVLAEVPEDESALEAVSVLEVAAALEADAVPDVEQLLELAPVIADDAVPCEPEVSACACRAAIRLCMNCWTAAAAVVASVAASADVEDEVDEEAADVDVVLPVVESEPVVELVLPTPLSCSASMIALINPPPGGGGGGLFVLAVAAVPPLDVDWPWLRKRDGSHCDRDDPELPIELTLIIPAPTHCWWCVRRHCTHVRLSQAMFRPIGVRRVGVLP
jgi:hypothetical protein